MSYCTKKITTKLSFLTAQNLELISIMIIEIQTSKSVFRFSTHIYFLFKNEGGDSTWYIRKLVEKLSKVLFSVINWKLAIHTYLLVVSKKQKKQQIYHSCYNILLKCYSSLWLIQKTFEPFINNVLLKFHK